MKIQTPGTGGLARSISGHETGLPEKPPLQATRKGGKWRVVHPGWSFLTVQTIFACIRQKHYCKKILNQVYYDS